MAGAGIISSNMLWRKFDRGAGGATDVHSFAKIRADALEKAYRSAQGSVILWQEADKVQADEMCRRLGTWQHAGISLNRVAWDSAKWEAVGLKTLRLPEGQKRTAAFMTLKRKSTGKTLVLCSTHLIVYMPHAHQVKYWGSLRYTPAQASKARRQQGKAICEFVMAHYPKETVVLGADFNDRFPQLPGTLRGLMKDRAGFVSMRNQGIPVLNSGMASWDGFKPLRKGHWIDDMMSRNGRLVHGAMLDTGKGSDHNLLRATIVW